MAVKKNAPTPSPGAGRTPPRKKRHPAKNAAPLPCLPLEIQGYATEGQGVARLPDGMACFVSGALAGETCLVQLEKIGKSSAVPSGT